jgi:hypothetical protein
MVYISELTDRLNYGHLLDSEAFNSRRPIQLPDLGVQKGEIAKQKLECWLYKVYLRCLTAAEEFLTNLFGFRKW